MPAVPQKGPSRPSLVLRFISGKYQGGEFQIEEGRPIVVGRSSELDMVLVEEMVSRKHARIELRDGWIQIEDLGSTNGTFVNGERIVKGHLKEGDRVLIGSNILRVLPASAAVEEPAAPTTSRAPAEAAAPPRVAGLPSPRRTESQAEARMRGSVEEIPLPDLLQLFGTSRKTGVLVVETDREIGRIFLKNGVIHQVTVEHLGGLEVPIPSLKAIYRMLAWEKGSFELEPPSTREFLQPLDASVQEVLMEGFRQRDEFEHMRPRLPSPDAVLSLESPLARQLRELSPAELDAFQVVLGGSTFSSYLDASPATDLDAASALLALIERGYVKKPI
ncbi:MAG: DUF4388 domain-containing protein [Deltaproteobacteria bacterium]|nr:DUF4388 domain-containing protein [Deltaproteobacteria bacterium]